MFSRQETHIACGENHAISLLALQGMRCRCTEAPKLRALLLRIHYSHKKLLSKLLKGSTSLPKSVHYRLKGFENIQRIALISFSLPQGEGVKIHGVISASNCWLETRG